MRFEWKTGFLLLGWALLTACADSGQKCGNKVLAIVPTTAGEYNFQEVVLSTLNNPYELSGGAAKIYFESIIGANGFAGKVAQPRYTRSGDLCVPMDAASTMAVSLYAQFEKIMMFEAKNETLDMLQWPRRVGLDIHVRSTDGMTHNNAHYFGAGDSIAVLPYNLTGVPLGLNPGVMAHEHFHGHFQRQVNAPLNGLLPSLFDIESVFYGAFNLAATSAKPAVEDVEGGDMTTPRGLNAYILRAWNEGLADFYGSIYAGNPRFFNESLPNLKDTRALNATLVRFVSSKVLAETVQRVQDPKSLVAVSYEQGSYLARLMYALSQSGVEAPEKFLVRVMRKLKDIPTAVVPTYESKVIEFEAVVPMLLKDFPLDAKTCGLVRKSISKELMAESFTACPAL